MAREPPTAKAAGVPFSTVGRTPGFVTPVMPPEKPVIAEAWTRKDGAP